MTKALFTSILFLVITTSTWAQYSIIDRETVIESEVPEMVLKEQKKQFRDGFVIGWKLHVKNKTNQDDVTYYMSNFKRKGRVGNYAYFAENGELLAYSIYINAFDLPGGIQDYCNSNFQEKSIKSAELIDLENPTRFIYRVRLNNDGMLRYIYFDNNSNPIEKSQLPPEIFMFI